MNLLYFPAPEFIQYEFICTVHNAHVLVGVHAHTLETTCVCVCVCVDVSVSTCASVWMPPNLCAQTTKYASCHTHGSFQTAHVYCLPVI